ncbi:uncharacterized protein L3040_006763 [Drepanopeziza brunnea f. sp. 'multigermtubi']|uniref:Flavoprotein monooxygenase n=1 Tax=Marssonina brunnea f. sp. multigermtubi (strain MB_m1) TaxID=1072389 RepID=K1X062_MARBU|nr:flavoprotein monooxygenase [Drepanopeziza brunnea f. sp. 'multigermtubi' MB_m1]EKD18362.1 flavoprotein monooxygenase [Drepanopeziza brunnea f. sp. 'multigermtubi' MB_m1]KAJ5039093.1 hypothetical protein L3040_006763 [Drepanopeziza brunnea f. sp. 'multigermtubi']
MPKPFRILISGGGVAGPILAYWLSRIDTTRQIHITMIERASSVATSDQRFEVQGLLAFLENLFHYAKTIKTDPRGIDAKIQPQCDNAIPREGGPSNEPQSLPEELCDVLSEIIKEEKKVKVQYERKVIRIEEEVDRLIVTIQEKCGRSVEEVYDIAVGADGVRSKTRELMLHPADLKECIKLAAPSMFAAILLIPAESQDSLLANRWRYATKARCLFIQQITETVSSVWLIAVGHHPDLAPLQSISNDRAKREAWVRAFSDLDYGEFPRILHHMKSTKSFHTDQMTQVRLPAWYNGRCALVGDAAFSPSVGTAQSTRMAVIGAYVLAGEIGLNMDDPQEALWRYDAKFRKIVEAEQETWTEQMPLEWLNPQTTWSNWARQTILSMVSSDHPISKLPETLESAFDLPDYKWRHFCV